MKSPLLRSKICFIISLYIFVSGFNLHAQNSEIKLDCFSVIVGKNASLDGSVLFAHNEDTGIKLVNTFKVPALKHEEGELIILENGGTVPQVAETLGYIWVNMPGISVCDTYLNEKGVAIGSDGCPSKETNPELSDGGIMFWLRRIVAERAHTSREGVVLAGELIQKFGYVGSGRTYIIADPNEAWMVAVVQGKHWLAQRIPDDHVTVIPNYYTIGEIDLSDTANFLGSKDIIEYAIEKGWYDPNQNGEFNFALAYTKPGSLHHRSNIRRHWRGLSLVSGHDFELGSRLPFSIKPKAKVSPKDLMAILRDHYEGTSLDSSKQYTLGSPYDMNGSMIGARSTQYGAIAQLRSGIPVEIGALLWLAPYRPDVQSFSPFYSGINSIPANYSHTDYRSAIKEQYAPPETTFDRSKPLSFWTFVSLVEKVDENYLNSGKIVKEKWNKIDTKYLKNQRPFEEQAQKFLEKDPELGREILTKYTEDAANKAYKTAKNLARKL